jgi:hypothetical protein
MSSSAQPTLTITRGISRFRVRVQMIGSGMKPYGWEILNEETGQIVRRSPQRFRTSAQAWQAGTKELETHSEPA